MTESASRTIFEKDLSARPAIAERSGPLAGVRVLDMTRVVAGPYGAQILGDLGAEIIKVERRGEGDDCRRVGPPWLKEPDAESLGESTYFQAANRNKRSLSVDFAKPEGAALLKRLAAQSDILLENYRTGTLARYGLGYEELKEINPGLIYCSITGFGQTGPYRDRSGYDFLVQGMAGMMGVNGYPDGEPGEGPLRVGIPIADICAGMNAVIAVVAALHHRNATGEGQYIDISLFESQAAIMLNASSAWLNAGTRLGRTGNDHPSAAPYGVYPVDDGYIIIATFNDREFGRLANVLGHPEWITDPRFARNGDRVKNRLTIKAAITEALRGKTRGEWVKILNDAVVSAGPINEISDFQVDPQVVARELIVSFDTPEYGKVHSVGSPLRFSATPCDYPLPPPIQGEHTSAILSEAGYSAEEIEALRVNQVV